MFANESSYLNKANLNSDTVNDLNRELQETEEQDVVTFNLDKMDYKRELMNGFRKIADPFDIEIVGNNEAEFNYEANPSEPT